MNHIIGTRVRIGTRGDETFNKDWANRMGTIIKVRTSGDDGIQVCGETKDDPFYTVKDEYGDTESFWGEEFEAIDVPCKWCGLRTTYLGTQECDPCHQIRVNAGINIKATEKILAFVKSEGQSNDADRIADTTIVG